MRPGNQINIVPVDTLRIFVFQAEHATEKGIDAVVFNEDTSQTAELWKRARTTASITYMSPEMALSESFQEQRDTLFQIAYCCVTGL